MHVPFCAIYFGCGLDKVGVVELGLWRSLAPEVPWVNIPALCSLRSQRATYSPPTQRHHLRSMVVLGSVGEKGFTRSRPDTALGTDHGIYFSPGPGQRVGVWRV